MMPYHATDTAPPRPCLADGERHYRYVAKADRAFAARLEAAARAEGVSVTALVQAHFETILDTEVVTRRAGRRLSATLAEIHSFAARRGLGFAAAQLWFAMCAEAGGGCVLTMGTPALGRLVGADAATAKRLLSRLQDAGLVETEQRAGSAPGIHRLIHQPEETP